MAASTTYAINYSLNSLNSFNSFNSFNSNILKKADEHGIDGDELFKILKYPLPEKTIVDWTNSINCLPYAKLASAVYNQNKNVIGNWIKIDEVKDILSGFHAATYKNNNSHDIVTAFEGTNPKSASDWMTNYFSFWSYATPQHVFAFNYMAHVFEKYGTNIRGSLFILK